MTDISGMPVTGPELRIRNALKLELRINRSKVNESWGACWLAALAERVKRKKEQSGGDGSE